MEKKKQEKKKRGCCVLLMELENQSILAGQAALVMLFLEQQSYWKPNCGSRADLI